MDKKRITKTQAEQLRERQIVSPFVDTEDVEKYVVGEYQKGAPVTKIMKKHKLSAGAFYKILAKHGVEKRNTVKNSATSEFREKTPAAKQKSIVEMYKRGVPLKLIYSHFDINKHTLYTLLSEYNVTQRSDIVAEAEPEEDHEIDLDFTLPPYKPASEDVTDLGEPEWVEPPPLDVHVEPPWMEDEVNEEDEETAYIEVDLAELREQGKKHAVIKFKL
jgi:hypothetical protein